MSQHTAIVRTQHKPTRARTVAELHATTEQLARDVVNQMIESGLMTWDMRDHGNRIVKHFADFIERDIRTYAETGKYPEYVSPVSDSLSTLNKEVK